MPDDLDATLDGTWEQERSALKSVLRVHGRRLTALERAMPETVKSAKDSLKAGHADQEARLRAIEGALATLTEQVKESNRGGILERLWALVRGGR